MEKPLILIVDDEPSTAGMFSLMLENEGYETVVVHGTGTAINAIRRHGPDLLLLDVMMPGVSGLELCRFIRREPDLSEIPIILVSAKNRPEDIEAGIEAGATLYLGKPIATADLLAGVKNALASTN